MEPHDVKANVRLTNITSLHANWVIQTYHYLKSSKNIFFEIQESSHN